MRLSQIGNVPFGIPLLDTVYNNNHHIFQSYEEEI